MSAENPTISVVLPVFREGPRLRALLDRIVWQSWGKDGLEIIVADAGSGDEAEAICNEYARQHPVRFLHVPMRGRAQGLNYAIRQARAPFIVRADGRSILPDDYIARLHATALETGAMVVGGVQRAVASQGGAWQSAIAIAMNSPCGAGPARHRTGTRSGPNDNVYLGLYRREVFETVGYFDEESAVISEEGDLHHRVRKAGGVVWLIADMPIAYEPRARLLDQFRLYYRYGGAKSAFIVKYGELITLRQLIAPGFWMVVFASALLSLFWLPALWLLGGLTGCYALALGGCALLESSRAGRPLLAPLVAVVAASMHLGYALGYVKKLLIKDPPGHYWGG